MHLVEVEAFGEVLAPTYPNNDLLGSRKLFDIRGTMPLGRSSSLVESSAHDLRDIFAFLQRTQVPDQPRLAGPLGITSCRRTFHNCGIIRAGCRKHAVTLSSRYKELSCPNNLQSRTGV